MYTLAFLGFIACAVAAPHYGLPPPRHHHHQYHHHDDIPMDRFFDDSVFKTSEFWDHFSKEMSRFDQMMEEFMAHFPRTISTAGFKDNQYVITISLNGFSEKDIVVKAKEGMVMVQAVRKNEDGGSSSYMDIRNLPEGVSPNGQWTYEQGLLKIVLPVTKGMTTEVVSTLAPTEAVTNASEGENTEDPTPEKDREEMESQEGDGNSMDADVGLGRDTELLTNEIPRHNAAGAVEATTYAIDVRNNFDFVPVNLK